MIKVIYSMKGSYGYDAGMREPPMVGSIIAETDQEAELISEHLRETFGSSIKILIIGQPGFTRISPFPHDFTTHEHSWTGALERLIELEPERDERLYWMHELKAMRNAYSVLRGEKEDD